MQVLSVTKSPLTTLCDTVRKRLKVFTIFLKLDLELINSEFEGNKQGKNEGMILNYFLQKLLSQIEKNIEHKVTDEKH